jgi:hypothetical protein
MVVFFVVEVCFVVLMGSGGIYEWTTTLTAFPFGLKPLLSASSF